MSDFRWHAASRHQRLPVSAKAHIGVADVKPRSGGRSQKQAAHEGQENDMSRLLTPFLMQSQVQPISAQANLRQQVKPRSGGRSQKQAAHEREEGLMSDFRWHAASRHQGLPVSAKAHIGVADVKPRSGGRNQDRQSMRGKGAGRLR